MESGCLLPSSIYELCDLDKLFSLAEAVPIQLTPEGVDNTDWALS